MGHDEMKRALVAEETGRVLLVDDEEMIRAGYERALSRRGWTVETARDGIEAQTRLERNTFDVVVSDLNMPGPDGLEFLRLVHELDPDLPVVLMTGLPTLESSITAIQYGAFEYLLKPVLPDALAEVVRRAARVHRMAMLKRQALDLLGPEWRRLVDRTVLEQHFNRALDLLWVAFQPIVSWKNRSTFGYEALLRSREPTLANPGAFLEAAEQLGRLSDIGRTVRKRVAEVAGQLPDEVKLFVNLHSSDLNDDDLLDPGSPLALIAPRVVLEITERASLDGVKDVSSRVRHLRQLGFQLAVDDLGAGYAGLASFTQLDPEIAKLDMSLVRDIDTQARKQSIVGSMKKLCDELGILLVVEGVETIAERDTLLSLGCDLFQGYLFSRPEAGFPVPRW
jgi:EAL domain-containing protein (putative c-di-GMP-specific phosphodiesterase class I)/CheY-like chemotaxis protein